MAKASKEYYGIFNDSFPPIIDGVATAVQNYCYWLQQRGLEPCVVTPWNPHTEPQSYRVVRFASIPIMGRSPYRYGIPSFDPFIWRKISHTPFALVHSHCPFTSGRLALYAKKKQGIPLVGTFHSKYRDDLERGFKGMDRVVENMMGKILNFYNACDRVWIPQAKVEETLREYGYRGRVEVVENGNDLADIPSTELPAFRTEARRKADISDNCLSLLFVGQHIWEKGIDIIAETLKLLNGQLDFHMTFVGTGYAVGDLKSMTRSMGLQDKVEFRGVVRDRSSLQEIYAAADLFLFPSFYDNAPLVVREAAAMGTPSVLLKGSTAAEVINDGKNGFLVEKSPESYAALLCKLAQDRQTIKMVGDGARDTLVRSWENVVEEVALRYKQILDEHRFKN